VCQIVALLFKAFMNPDYRYYL